MSGESRKEKKQRIRERNKRHNLINLMAWQHEGVGERGDLAAPEYNPEKSREEDRRKEREEEMVWSEKVAFVRNRVTGKKRVAKERWNRFAGTKGGGGRGL